MGPDHDQTRRGEAGNHTRGVSRRHFDAESAAMPEIAAPLLLSVTAVGSIQVGNRAPAYETIQNCSMYLKGAFPNNSEKLHVYAEQPAQWLSPPMLWRMWMMWRMLPLLWTCKLWETAGMDGDR